MKRMISIVLLVLMASLLTAATTSVNKESIQVKTVVPTIDAHKITSVKLQGIDGSDNLVKLNAFASAVGIDSSSPIVVDLTNGEEMIVGHYNYRTNTKNPISVTLTANAFNDKPDGSGANNIDFTISNGTAGTPGTISVATNGASEIEITDFLTDGANDTRGATVMYVPIVVSMTEQQRNNAQLAPAGEYVANISLNVVSN